MLKIFLFVIFLHYGEIPTNYKAFVDLSNRYSYYPHWIGGYAIELHYQENLL